MRRGEAKCGSPDPMADTPATAARGRILVVDDQRNMRATTALLLRAEAYGVQEAASGEEALGILNQHQVDLVLTDLRMEPMDGLTLIKRVGEVGGSGSSRNSLNPPS